MKEETGEYHKSMIMSGADAIKYHKSICKSKVENALREFEVATGVQIKYVEMIFRESCSPCVSEPTFVGVGLTVSL